MWTRAELKSKAREAFKANYWSSVLVGLIMIVVSAASGGSGRAGSDDGASISDAISNGASAVGVSSAVFAAIVGSLIGAGVIISILITVLVKNAFVVGCNNFFIKTAEDDDATIGDVLHGFKSNYKNVVVAMFMMGLFVALWSLLFVIPGIIKSYEYRMVPYILADDPDVEWKEAFARSKEMMTGNKWSAFVLDLSFIGWHLLSVCTCGILSVFWVAPYVYTTDAELYLALKNN